ncbi:hypothetical protein [Kushneria phosphatilytica]|uniref:Uncharacterized protein n=1 Tax=Kushneria phosphatilytica TaxID=657387 RepID=A0A5C0ZZ16_9GAMM|nr:hypothetical protein [Kushneria phosphatilytica]QEL11792.1 hypothetical protein FY550_12015 [Kushneria phosphatilytica]
MRNPIATLRGIEKTGALLRITTWQVLEKRLSEIKKRHPIGCRYIELMPGRKRSARLTDFRIVRIKIESITIRGRGNASSGQKKHQRANSNPVHGISLRCVKFD